MTDQLRPEQARECVPFRTDKPLPRVVPVSPKVHEWAEKKKSEYVYTEPFFDYFPWCIL